MTDHPCIMSAPMILATLREVREPGTGKTETRRLAWREVDPESLVGRSTHGYRFRQRNGSVVYAAAPTPWQKLQPGARLWVRENFHPWKGSATGKTIVYVADDQWIDWGSGERFHDKVHWVSPMTPSIHMPRWASRLTLIVEAIKIERLQDIDEDAAKREGCGLYVTGHGWITCDELHADPGYSNFLCARSGFEDIWQTLHGRESWAANPWVVAVRFRPILANIDAPEAKAA